MDETLPIGAPLPGVQVMHGENELVMRPDEAEAETDDTGLNWRPFPMVPGSILERCLGICRTFWCQEGAHVCLALVVDMDTKQWMPILPPQECGPWGARCSLKMFDGLRWQANWRVAGSFMSAPIWHLGMPEFEALGLPETDGVHFVADGWFAWSPILVYRRIQGLFTSAGLESVLGNEHMDVWENWRDQIQVTQHE